MQATNETYEFREKNNINIVSLIILGYVIWGLLLKHCGYILFIDEYD